MHLRYIYTLTSVYPYLREYGAPKNGIAQFPKQAKVSLEDLYKVFPAPMSPTPISPMSGRKDSDD